MYSTKHSISVADFDPSEQFMPARSKVSKLVPVKWHT